MSKEIPCAVCSARAAGYNYGAVTCNACKMFFRRVHVRNKVEDCKFQNGNCLVNCTFCRFFQCLQAGMVFHPVINTHDFRNNEIVLSTIVKNLVYMDNHRIKLFNNFHFRGKDPSFRELLAPITFTEKTKEHRIEYTEWGFMSGVTSIDFLKKLHFMNELNAEDIILVLKNIFIQFSVFSVAYNCYEINRNTMIFPDGTEIPEQNVTGVSEELRRRIQGRLVAKLIELKVTKEEFLLLIVIFLCNPGIVNLSDHGKSIIFSKQKYYVSALFHHCLLTYQKSGPSRFTDLLFSYQVICKTLEDMTAHYEIRTLKNARLPVKKIFSTNRSDWL